ncbi:MAG: tetratricopeptide repeat protein [Gemmatimonadales bacterium]|nr:tetratricopeptide repeat protein [Gemmatimonadales bacterium]MYC89692.1 tetratricopeptide repeat protein [Candidatus Palauibacter denitrificans]
MAKAPPDRAPPETGDAPWDAVESLFQRGMAARREGRTDEAMRHMKAAVALARRGEDPLALARALHGQANVERDRGRTRAALDLYLEAVPLCRQGDDPLVFAHTVRHLGDVLRELGDLTKAERCYAEALAAYRADPATPPLDAANAVRSAAILSEARDEPDQARQRWREALDLYRRARIEAGVSESASHLERLR